MELDVKFARRLALAAQGLLRRNAFGRGAAAVARAIEHLGYVQIDTISVVARAHHHTLWNRVDNYSPDMLHKLQQKKRVFEYWSHAAAYLPVRDFRFARHTMERIRRRGRHWYKCEPQLVTSVLHRVRQEGPLMTRDFESGYRAKGMWDLKPSKRALHELFMQGRLMVIGREGFQHIYDVPERALPDAMDQDLPTDAEFARYLIKGAIRAHGLVLETEIGYLRKGWSPVIRAEVRNMLDRGELCSLTVADKTYLSQPWLLDEVPHRLGRRRVKLISPFDNVAIQRKRLQQLFAFNYQAEIYLPREKRVHGYFNMPLLWGERFVGRVDPKADRKQRTLIIKQAGLEPHLKQREKAQMIEPLAEALAEFARFNGCERVMLIRDVAFPGLPRRQLESAVAQAMVS